MNTNDTVSSDIKLQHLFTKVVKAVLTSQALSAFFLFHILLLPFWALFLVLVPQRKGYSPLLLVLRPSHPFLLLNQFQRVSLADDLRRGLWCSAVCPAKCCQFSLLVNPGDLWEQGPAAVSFRSLSCPSLHSLSAAFSFFRWPQPLCYDYRIPVFWDLVVWIIFLWTFEQQRDSSLQIGWHILGNTLNIKYYILPSSYNFFLQCFSYNFPPNFSITLNLLGFRGSIDGKDHWFRKLKSFLNHNIWFFFQKIL